MRRSIFAWSSDGVPNTQATERVSWESWRPRGRVGAKLFLNSESALVTRVFETSGWISYLLEHHFNGIALRKTSKLPAPGSLAVYHAWISAVVLIRSRMSSYSDSHVVVGVTVPSTIDQRDGHSRAYLVPQSFLHRTEVQESVTPFILD